MIRPAKCPDGHEVAAVSLLWPAQKPTVELYHVRCEEPWCWSGPERRTRAAAVRAWNRAMAKKRGGGE